MFHNRRILALVLTFALLAALASTASADAAQPEYFHKYDPPITLTTHAVVSTSNVFLDGDTAENNGLTRWFTEHLGITWKLKWTAGDAETDSQKLGSCRSPD